MAMSAIADIIGACGHVPAVSRTIKPIAMNAGANRKFNRLANVGRKLCCIRGVPDWLVSSILIEISRASTFERTCNAARCGGRRAAREACDESVSERLFAEEVGERELKAGNNVVASEGVAFVICLRRQIRPMLDDNIRRIINDPDQLCACF